YSNDENVVKVSQAGVLEGIGVGRTTVIISQGQVRRSILVFVAATPVALTAIDAPSTLNVPIGYPVKVEAKPIPEDATDLFFEWSSSDEDVATVSPDGRITANVNAIGSTAVITVKQGEVEKNISITVVKPTMTAISDPNITKIGVSYTETITVGPFPSTADYAPFTWTSLTPDLATVTAAGVVTANKTTLGIAKLRVTSGTFSRDIDLEIFSRADGSWVLSKDASCVVTAVNWDIGGDGYGYGNDSNTGIETSGGTAGGQNIGYVVNGEWRQYTVYVKDAGQYTAKMWLSGTGGQMHLEVDGSGNNDSGTLVSPSQGGWHNWTNANAWVDFPNPLTLSKGYHVIRYVVDVASHNYKGFEFTFKP
ncbi:MAG: Ig-like domain-containing protein, partial [Bacteroidales bacterium]|nr:Ig-like domain-containing protein [Bacteroidales bacterium]